jgi:hypothetical protein
MSNIESSGLLAGRARQDFCFGGEIAKQHPVKGAKDNKDLAIRRYTFRP